MKIEGRGKSADYVQTVTSCYRKAIDAYYDGSFSLAKAESWIEKMRQVYNRDFWGGYYLGKELGEWTNSAGSKALTRKIYIGKGNHYYPKTGIAEFLVEAYSLKLGDKVMVISAHNGVTETIITSLHVNARGAQDTAIKGDLCAFPLQVPVKASDKLYKIVDAIQEEPN